MKTDKEITFKSSASEKQTNYAKSIVEKWIEVESLQTLKITKEIKKLSARYEDDLYGFDAEETRDKIIKNWTGTETDRLKDIIIIAVSKYTAGQFINKYKYSNLVQFVGI